jgi:hypothetical protein
MKLLMKKNLTKIVSPLLSKILRRFSSVLVAPFDGTIISHIISQVRISDLISNISFLLKARISMDLTKITLPTFILERRSLLEMLADFLAHPDEFVKYV